MLATAILGSIEEVERSCVGVETAPSSDASPSRKSTWACRLWESAGQPSVKLYWGKCGV